MSKQPVPILEELLWSCSCGAPMALELSTEKSRYDFDCRHCGLIAELHIHIGKIKI